MKICQGTILVLLLATLIQAAHHIEGGAFTEVLDDLAKNTLGAAEIQEYLDNGVDYQTVTRQRGDIILEDITSSMKNTFTLLDDAVTELRDVVQNVMTSEDTFLRSDADATQYEPCLSVTELKENLDFPNLKVNMEKMCVVGPGVDNPDTQYPSQDSQYSILEVMKGNSRSIKELKWQYIALEENYVINYPATEIKWPNYQPRTRSWYKETASPRMKDIVLVFDKSRAMQPYLIDGQMVKVLTTVISTLSPKDRIGIVAFDGEALSPSGCYSDRLALSIPVNIQAMEDFVNEIQLPSGSSGQSNYTKAFHMALQYFINSPSQEPRDKVILFMSDGRPTDTEDDILTTISQQNAKLNNEVTIHTFGIGSRATEEGPTKLMTNIAEQIKSQDGIYKVSPGQYRTVSDAEELRRIMADSYNTRPSSSSKAVLSGPYHDGFGFGIVYSACLPIHKNGNTFIGVTCIDILMRDLVEDLVSYPCFQHTNVAYTFMLDGSGRYVYHPLLPLSVNKEDEPVYADFSVLEREETAGDIRDSMLRGETDSVVRAVNHVKPRGTTQGAGIDTRSVNLTYFWGPISDTPFAVCVVIDDQDNYTDFNPTSFPSKVLYHRTDLSKKPLKTCNDYNRIVLKDNAVVVLTETAFRTPSRYYNLENIKSENVTDIQTFLEQGSPNPMHIKDDVRNAIAVLYGKLEEMWLERREDQESVMARYVGTREGVLIQMPGIRFPHPYDHTKRGWYIQTIHSDTGSALVGPYKDASSGLSIVTLTRTLIIPGGQILGVAGLDFSLNHLYSHFIQAYPECDTEEYICTIVDDSGLVVLRKEFTESADNIPADDVNRHIVFMEPSIAKELVNEGIIRSSACFNSKTIIDQIYFTIEIPESYNGTVKGNLFTMDKVPGTNVFIIVKNSEKTDYDDEACNCLPSRECYSGSGDCPCPCHKAAEYDYCENQLPINLSVSLPCYPEAPSYSFEDLVEKERSEVSGLPLCYDHKCGDRETQLSCESVFSCKWCKQTSCKPTSECPDPTLGPKTDPLGTGGSSSMPVSSIAGGAVAGGLVAVLVIALLVVILKKRHLQRKPATQRVKTFTYAPSTVSTYMEPPEYAEADDVSTLRSTPSTLMYGVVPGDLHGSINPAMVYKERPLPATPPVHNPSPQEYQMVRESSVYNNLRPTSIPAYFSPQPDGPPDVISPGGVGLGSPGNQGPSSGRGTGSPGGYFPMDNSHVQPNNIGATNPVLRRDLSGFNGNPPGQSPGDFGSYDAYGNPGFTSHTGHSVSPYSNSDVSDHQRPLSIASSGYATYGQIPRFQNQLELEEHIREESYRQREQLQQRSPTYVNSEAAHELRNRQSFGSDTAYGQTPVFENAEVMDGILEENNGNTSNISPKRGVKGSSSVDLRLGPAGVVSPAARGHPSESRLGVNPPGHGGIFYVNSSSVEDSRPLSTGSSVDYGTAPMFENSEVFI